MITLIIAVVAYFAIGALFTYGIVVNTRGREPDWTDEPDAWDVMAFWLWPIFLLLFAIFSTGLILNAPVVAISKAKRAVAQRTKSADESRSAPLGSPRSDIEDT